MDDNIKMLTVSVVYEIIIGPKELGYKTHEIILIVIGRLGLNNFRGILHPSLTHFL